MAWAAGAGPVKAPNPGHEKPAWGKERNRKACAFPGVSSCPLLERAFVVMAPVLLLNPLEGDS